MSEARRTGSIVVTGTSRGFGRYAAARLAREGWHVIPTARTDAALDELRAAGLEPVALDLADAASIDACAKAIQARADGVLYGLVNNAATGTLCPVAHLTEQQLLAEFRANVIGPALLTARLLPAMSARGGGRVVFISSVLAMLANPRKGAYAASKSALNTLASALRMENAHPDIFISTVMPGPIHDPDQAGASARKALAAVTHADVFHHLDHALTARRPRARYHTGVVTKAVALATRLLPQSWIEAAIRRASARSGG